MNNLEIHKAINANNEWIEKLLTPNVFTLNNSVCELLKENEKLQAQCTHEYLDGFCIYCYKEEPNGN